MSPGETAAGAVSFLSAMYMLPFAEKRGSTMTDPVKYLAGASDAWREPFGEISIV